MSAAAPARKGIFASLAAMLGKARDELAEVRAEVVGLKADIELEQSRPLPLAVVEARVEATVARLRAHTAERLAVAGALVRPDGGATEHVLNAAAVPGFAAVAMVDPDGLRRWLLAQAEAALATLPEPATDEVREARLAELRRKLAEAEKRESALCWSAHEAGMNPGWRADLDPSAALGLDP